MAPLPPSSRPTAPGIAAYKGTNRSAIPAVEDGERKIAATSELTQDERRKAMLIVLRAWEGPPGSQDARALVDALLRDMDLSTNRSPRTEPRPH